MIFGIDVLRRGVEHLRAGHGIGHDAGNGDHHGALEQRLGVARDAEDDVGDTVEGALVLLLRALAQFARRELLDRQLSASSRSANGVKTAAFIGCLGDMK